ncbi:hypothetical protein [Psychrilyobacter sp.]|uniref:hypothetical protein n=1 Tax=Psychrilyobacter sp. TaxID=2586924 RepID=UPI003018C4FE
MLLYCGICFASDPRPYLEGRIIKNEEDNSTLARIERKVGIPTEFYRRLEVETGEEPYISIGINTKITPYYAKIRYLLDPGNEYSLYYLFSGGVNLAEGEEINFDKFLDNLEQSINYGIGIGITIKNVEFEILYGKYNYQILGAPQEEEENLYSSAKLTFNCKYRF